MTTIAPMSGRSLESNNGSDEGSPAGKMPYTCQACAKRYAMETSDVNVGLPRASDHIEKHLMILDQVAFEHS